MIKDEEQLIANLMYRMHANEQARLDAALSSARADAVTRAEADRVRMESVTEELRKEREAHAETADYLNKASAQLRDAAARKESELIEAAHKTATVLQHREGENLLSTARRVFKERDGLLTQVQDMREEIIRVNDAHGRTIVERDALRAEVAALQERLRASIARGDVAQMELAALKSQTPKHPVKVGEYVTWCGSPGVSGGTIKQVAEIRDDRAYRFTDGGVWSFALCEPCDPPNHDTEAGKAAAESAAKTEPVEIKVGDLVEVVSNRGSNTWFADVGSFGTVTSVEEINDSILVNLDNVPGKKNALVGCVSFCDVRKVTT